MSKYIAAIPLKQVKKIAVVLGNGRNLKQVKAASGADLVMNGGFYSMTTGRPTNHLKIGGTVLAKEPWGCWGFAWDGGPDIRMEALPADKRRNYIGGVELLSPMIAHGDKPQYGAEVGGKRGRTAIALTGDKLVLYCSGDGTKDAATPEDLQDELYKLGAETAVMLDGGGSSQCDFGGGRVISSSRRVNNYICVWLKEPEKEDKPVSKTVCLDPGHGPGCVNGSPDGTYKENEFAWDMSQRVKAHLERCGVKVVMTKDEAGYPSLTERANISNRAGADLFVSLHSNADGSTGWGTARGLLVYTSAAGDTAGRNLAARAVLQRVGETEALIHGTGLYHEMYTVLAKTTAPAVLIEYGFHTNREDVRLLLDSAHRAKLAEATAKGILDFVGGAWMPADAPEPPDKTWYAEAQKWAVESGVSDGARPLDGATRAEVWEMFRKYDEAVKAGK